VQEVIKSTPYPPPPNVTYASLATRESIRIGFMLASLNELNILSADIAGTLCRKGLYDPRGRIWRLCWSQGNYKDGTIWLKVSRLFMAIILREGFAQRIKFYSMPRGHVCLASCSEEGKRQPILRISFHIHR